MGLWRPRLIDDDEGAGPYRDRSIESLLVVLLRRVDRRAVDADQAGDDEDGDGSVTAASVSAPFSACDGAAADLETLDVAPRRFVWPRGAVWLISCSLLARPGLLTCLGLASRLEDATS